MSGIKNIFIVVFSLVILISANGFFVEKYLCNGCNEEKSDIAFFEFGEISHNHTHCDSCEAHTCSCHTEEHEKNSQISFFSLNQLFFNNFRFEFPVKISIEIPDFLSQSLGHIDFKIFSHSAYYNIKIPPLIYSIAGSTDLCAVFSIFRL
ncbi:MAG: hypothetical protein PHH30_02355 [Bacteroidales bacterium]|nr:hypothetical protein [Bacteroidales bacterium]